jgi:Outer membrane efflux protein
VRTITRTLALTAFLLGSAVFGQESPPTKPDNPAKDKKPSQLEELLGEALRGNPDVRVAEARFREAEAELNRARMLALQKVVAAQHNVDAANNAVKTAEAGIRLSEAKLQEAKVRLDRTTALQRMGTTSLEEVDQAKATALQAQADLEIAKAALQAAKADVARAQAQMPYLLGKAPGNAESLEAARQRDLERLLYAKQITAAQEALAGSLLKPEGQVAPPAGATADKLRKALDKPVNLRFDEAPLADVFTYLTEVSGVSLVNNTTSMENAKIRLTLAGPVPLGAAFQALEDTAGVQFAVRDYGILVVNKLPPSMMSVRTFWKGETTSEKPKPETPAKPKQSRTNPPKDSVEGAVTSIDEKSGMMLVTVGSDAGLQKGHTLEVYRKMGDKQFKYLGTVTVEEVQPTRSVGKFVRPPNGPAAVGDRVSSKFFVD